MFLVVETVFSSRKKVKTMSFPCLRVKKNSGYNMKKKCCLVKLLAENFCVFDQKTNLPCLRLF